MGTLLIPQLAAKTSILIVFCYSFAKVPLRNEFDRETSNNINQETPASGLSVIFNSVGILSAV
jgi:hypothetical protein